MTIFAKKGKSEIKLKELTELLQEFRAPTSLVFTPTNLKEERKRFFESSSYNPLFTYTVVKNKNADILAKLSSVKVVTDVDPRISEFYLELIDSKHQLNELLHSVGQNFRFTRLSQERFGMPGDILFRNATRVLRGKVKNYKLMDEGSKKVERKLRYEEIAETMAIVLEELGLSDWKAGKSKNIDKNGVKVGIKKKEILMDPEIEKSAVDLRKTIVHEFTHIARAYNGEQTKVPALANSNLPSYLEAEEGLATYNEEMVGVLKKKDLVGRAVKVWAIRVGEQMSFRELYNATQAFAPRIEAFHIVYRVKRGLGDTNMPGIYSRDYNYFKGFRRVRNKVEKDPTIYEKLYAGKIGFSQIKWVDEGLIPKPKLVYSKKMFDDAFKVAGL
ncbi:MAG: DUF1704 domain-containing protein [Candidatus Dojkabacteria bacterium]|nr:MAG: DUF1704 domain-containing protein [Candidatus Dojkabacteria bacterium]